MAGTQIKCILYFTSSQGSMSILSSSFLFSARLLSVSLDTTPQAKLAQFNQSCTTRYLLSSIFILAFLSLLYFLSISSYFAPFCSILFFSIRFHSPFYTLIFSFSFSSLQTNKRPTRVVSWSGSSSRDRAAQSRLLYFILNAAQFVY